MALLTPNVATLTTPPPPLTKRPDLPRNSPPPQTFPNGPKGAFLYHAMTASLASVSPFQTLDLRSSTSSVESAKNATAKRAFSPSKYPGPPPTVKGGETLFSSGGSFVKTDATFRPILAKTNNAVNLTQPPQQVQAPELKVKIRKRTGCESSLAGTAVNKPSISDIAAKFPTLAPMPSASALNASLREVAAAAIPITEVDVTPKASSRKRVQRKSKTPTQSAKDSLAAYEDNLISDYAEVLYRCTLCSASTPAMFKTKRTFLTHFCSMHSKDSPSLKSVGDAVKAIVAKSNTATDPDSASLEPPSKRRRQNPEGGDMSSGLLAVADGLRKNGEIAWPYSILTAARRESTALVKETSVASNHLPNSPKTSIHKQESPSEPTNQNTPPENSPPPSAPGDSLKIELDSSPNISPTSQTPVPRIESTNRRKKGMMIPTKIEAPSPCPPDNNTIENPDEDYDMPPSPPPLLINEDSAQKKLKTVAAENSKNNNNNNNNNNVNLINNNLHQNNNGGKGSKPPKNSPKAYANALNALTGPGLSRSQLISAFSSPDAFKNCFPTATSEVITAPDGTLIKKEITDDMPVLNPDSNGVISLTGTLANLPLPPGIPPSFSNDPYVEALRTLFLLPSLSEEERLKIEKPYECDQCGRRFTRSDKVSRHKLIHTGEKPFECEVCFKRFHRSDKLTVHRKIHTGERPHECDVCGKRFTRHYHLTKHRSLHTGNRPHACNVCPKKFFDRYSQLRHMKTHPENAALFAACNTPQEVIEALNAVTGLSAVGENQAAPALPFSPTNAGWTKEMEALFNVAKGQSQQQSGRNGVAVPLEEEGEDEDYDEDDTDDDSFEESDAASLDRRFPSKKGQVKTASAEASPSPAFVPMQEISGIKTEADDDGFDNNNSVILVEKSGNNRRVDGVFDKFASS